MRSDGPPPEEVLDRLSGIVDVSATELPPTEQFDLSLEFGAGQRSKRPMLSLRHGERAVVRTRSADRLIAATADWIAGLCRPAGGVHLQMMTAALDSGRVSLVPRFATADLGLLESLAPADVEWIDAPWIEIEPDGSIRSPLRNFGSGSPHAIGLDRGHLELDLSSPARRAVSMLGYLAAAHPGEIFERAVRLGARSDIRWATVNTEDSAASCRALAALVF